MKTVKKTVRKYYKYDTENPIYNLVEVGTLTKNNGVISGFSSSNYCYTLQQINYSSITNLELNVTFTTGSDVSSEQAVVGGVTQSLDPILIEVVSGKFRIRLDGNSNSTTIDGITVLPNTQYAIKIVYDNGWIYYVNDVQVATSSYSKSYLATDYVGFGGEVGSSRAEIFAGFLDLSESYIKINGEYWWQGVTYPIIEGTSSDYDFYKDVEVYKIVKKTIREYYKYIDTPWVQPVLSANGTLGGDSFAVAASSTYSSSNQAYRAFDNNATTSFYPNGSPYSITFYNPTPIKISSLLIANRDQNNNCIKTGYVSGSEDGINYTKLCDFTNSNYASYGTWTINVNSPDGYNYYMLYASTTFGYYSGVSSINITAVTQSIEESDSSDYDFYEDINKYKAAKF